MNKQEPTKPSDTGHADYAATDFLDTMPMIRDEAESPPAPAPAPAPARPVSREPIERAMARHETASVALAATIGANRDEVPQPPRSTQPASPARPRIDSTAKAGAGQERAPRPDAQSSPARAARAMPPSIAVSTKGDEARRLREDWAVNSRKTHVATLSPSRPRSDEGTRASSWIEESRQPPRRAARRQEVHRGTGARPFVRATLLAISVGTVVIALSGAVVYIARRGAASSGPGQMTAAAKQGPEAVAPAPHADAAAVAVAGTDNDATRPSTSAPDTRMASGHLPPAVPSRTKNRRDATDVPRRETAPGPASQYRPSARGATPSTNVASAVEAAQAKADAFLQHDAQEPPEQAPAKSGTSDLPREAGRS